MTPRPSRTPAFKGFSEGRQGSVPIPAAFFRELLPQIDSLAELKLIAYIFYRLENMEGGFRAVSFGELSADERLIAGLGDQLAQDALAQAAQSAVQRGVLLEVELETAAGADRFYLLNSPKGRAALRAIQSGQWRPPAAGEAVAPPGQEAPNIFRLYEENIGPLTPLMAETLGEAEDTYPPEWIVDALRIAVERNKRTWRYVAAILERWQREGRYAKQEKPQDRPDSPEARRKYVEGDYSDFIEH